MNNPGEYYHSDPESERQRGNKAAIASDSRLAATNVLWIISKLCNRADVAEESATQLLRCIITASSDKELLGKIAGQKRFPAKDESTYIQEKVEELENRVMGLEKTGDIKKISIGQPKMKREENDRKDIVALPECVHPVSKMYKGMKRSAIILSLGSEIRLMKKEYEILIKNQNMFKESSKSLKDHRGWNLLCNCIEEVDNMKNILNTMTDGQFEKGIIDYVDPKRVENLANKLEETGNKLHKMEADLERLKNFKQETEDMLAKCNPILEQLYIAELKGDTYAQDLKQANEISSRIGEMELSVEYMSNTTALLLARLEGRIALIDATVKKMGLLKEAKADKDFVENVLQDKADKKLVRRAVSIKGFKNVYDDITEKLKVMLENIKKQMEMWNTKLDSFLHETELKIKALLLEKLLQEVEKKIKRFYDQLENLENAHKQEKAIRDAEDRKKFKSLQCISCDKDAIMNCKTDVGLPFLAECHPTKNIGPIITYKLKCFGKDKRQQWNRNELGSCYSYIPCSVLYRTCGYCVGVEKYTCTSAPSTAQESLVRVVEFNDYYQSAQPSTYSEGNKKIMKKKSSTEKTPLLLHTTSQETRKS